MEQPSSSSSSSSSPTPEQPQQPEIRLVDVPVQDENTALNLLVSFAVLAHKRGAFQIDESAKIWECIKVFQKAPPAESK